MTLQWQERRIRLIVRVSFLMLIVGVVAMLVLSVAGQRQLSYAAARQDLERRLALLQNALLTQEGRNLLSNPRLAAKSGPPLQVHRLRENAMLVKEPAHVNAAMKNLGCRLEEPGAGSLCAAVASTEPRLYLVGSVTARELTPMKGALIQSAHRLKVEATLDERWRIAWSIPVQQQEDKGKTRLGLAAYRLNEHERAEMDNAAFSGFIARGSDCRGEDGGSGCLREWFYALAIPLKAWQGVEGLQRQVRERASAIRFRVRFLAPGPATAAPIFDSERLNRSPQMRMLGAMLSPGEVVMVGRKTAPTEVEHLFAVESDASAPAAEVGWVQRAVSSIPVSLGLEDGGLGAERIFFANGSDYVLSVVEKNLPIHAEVVASAAVLIRYVAVLLLALFVSYLAIELGVLRRVLAITGRTLQVARAAREGDVVHRSYFADLRGTDELGKLANGLDDMVRRISDDRLKQQHLLEMKQRLLQIIDHETANTIDVLHGLVERDPKSLACVRKVAHAVRGLHDANEIQEGIAKAVGTAQHLELYQWIKDICVSHAAQPIHFECDCTEAYVHASPIAIENALDNLLGNAVRYRADKTGTMLHLKRLDDDVVLTVSNRGPQLSNVDKIFNYGESDRGRPQQRGIGLFVTKLYIGACGGTINARNTGDGVAFEIRFPIADQPLAGVVHL